MLSEWDVLFPIIAAIELVGPRPHDGKRSTHIFGRRYGVVKGALFALGVSFYSPTPQVWQRSMALGGKQTDRKAASRDKAKALWPKLKGITKETGDAVLIAEYARMAYLNNLPIKEFK